MARFVDETEYALRRNEILDAAQRLVNTKGYGQMAIQDILDDLKISKGAFYHYFSSKQALLEALVDRIRQEAEKVIVPIVQDPDLPALAKLERFFDTITRWKTAQKTYLLALLHVWYHEENAMVRQKVYMEGPKWITPLLTQVIQQGVREGAMNTLFPDRTGEVVVALSYGLGDTMAELLLSLQPDSSEASRRECLHHLERTAAAYTDAIERVVGAATGSLNLFNVESLKEWVTP